MRLILIVVAQFHRKGRRNCWSHHKTVIALLPQYIGLVQYQRGTRKLVLLEYCTQPIYCGIDAVTDDNFPHYIFIISLLWLTFHPRSTVALLDTGTLGASREIYSEDADGETRTRNPSVINRVFPIENYRCQYRRLVAAPRENSNLMRGR